MKEILIKTFPSPQPAIVVGCMRFAEKSPEYINRFVHEALEMGCTYFDHADIYGGGECERLFGQALSGDKSISREKIVIQSKCGIKPGEKYDLSKSYILSAVDGILARLKTGYLDSLLLHRPDALYEPEEIAQAFDILQSAGKVRSFGVSNFRPMQISLLQKYVRQSLAINQLQFSIPASNMIQSGLEANMTSEGACDRDGSALDYCRLNDITVQAWSPFQAPAWQGPFIGSPNYPELNAVLDELAKKYEASPTAIAAAWILRHPAKIQVVTGTTSPEHLKQAVDAGRITLSREEWYRLYLSGGHILP